MSAYAAERELARTREMATARLVQLKDAHGDIRQYRATVSQMANLDNWSEVQLKTGEWVFVFVAGDHIWPRPWVVPRASLNWREMEGDDVNED